MHLLSICYVCSVRIVYVKYRGLRGVWCVYVVLAGFNIDRCNNNNVLTRKLKEFSDTCNFTQLIQDYTRVTDNSKTVRQLLT